MWKYVRYYFLYVYYHIWLIWKRYFGPIIVPTKDPIEEYVRPRKTKLLKTYDLNLNANIDPVIYDRKRLAEHLKVADNSLERLWKSRILYDPTPRGTIMMYYDIYKQGFAYYADQNNVPYSVLNGMAMKYVVMFFCRDFYFDETIIGKASPLAKVFLEDDVSPIKVRRATVQQQMITSKEVVAPPPVRNKFISLGNMRNFALLQKTKSPKQMKTTATTTSHDTLFSYKDFKNKYKTQ
jgi:hypothetical protein